jgi:hypothetical protein
MVGAPPSGALGQGRSTLLLALLTTLLVRLLPTPVVLCLNC